MLPNILDLLHRKYFLRRGLRLPKNSLSDAIVPLNFNGQVLEVLIDHLHVRVAEVSKADDALLPNVNHSSRIGEHVDLFHVGR